MNQKIQKYFTGLIAVVLFVAATTKLAGAVLSSPMLDYRDPLLLLSNRNVLYASAGVEFVISALLLMTGNERRKLAVIAWLTIVYLLYRACLWWAGEPFFWSYLGNLTDRLAVPPRLLNWSILLVLGGIFACAAVLWSLDWFKSKEEAVQQASRKT